MSLICERDARRAEIYDFDLLKKRVLILSLILALSPLSCFFWLGKLCLLSLLSTPLLYYGLLTLYIKLKIQSRKEKIDQNLHILYSSLLGLSKAGMNLKDIIYEISTLDLEEISKEFAKIYNLVKFSGSTLRSALLDVAMETPSEKLGDLLRGIVGVIEAGGDLSRYIEDKLRLLEVERKIVFSNYIKKLEVLAEIYTTVIIAIPITVISLYLARTVSGSANVASVYGIIYVFMPLSTACIIFAIQASNPEKSENRGLKFIAAIPIFAIVGFLFQIYFKAKICTLLGIILGCVVSWYCVRGAINEEKTIAEELPNYFEKVISLVEAGKDTTTAFVMATKEVRGSLKKYISSFSEMITRGVPKNKAFEWLMRVSPQKDLRIASKILSKTICVSGKTLEVLLSLSNEILRLNAYRTEREGIAKLYGAIILMLSFTFFGIAAMITKSLLFSLNISSKTISSIKSILDSACLIVGISASVGYAAIRGDFRYLPVPLLLTSIGLAVMEAII